MRWKKNACVFGALLLPASVLLADTKPQHAQHADIGECGIVGVTAKVATGDPDRAVDATEAPTKPGASKAAEPIEPKITAIGQQRPKQGRQNRAVWTDRSVSGKAMDDGSAAGSRNVLDCPPDSLFAQPAHGTSTCAETSKTECLSVHEGGLLGGENCDPNRWPQSPSDGCADAPSIGDVTDLPFDTTTATFDGTGTCQYAPNVWACYTATCTGAATVSLCGSGYDTKLAVYDRCTCEPLGTELGCDDDACGLQSELTIPVLAGDQYLIEIGGYETDTGTGVLTIACVEWPQGACCVGHACYIDYGPMCLAAGGFFDGGGSACSALDCNGNRFDDTCDILEGTSQDCNGNQIPDECDIADGYSHDADVNGVPDECDPDCNGNDIPDGCDVGCPGDCLDVYGECGDSLDCQGDGVPDECQLGGKGVLWDNGPMITHPGTGYGGADVSEVPGAVGGCTYGYGHQLSAGNRVADDFTLERAAHIETITFYAYQSYAPGTTSTITAVNLQIWDGPPNARGTVIWGDQTTNLLINTEWSGIYRVDAGEFLNTDRAIMANTVAVDVHLHPGTYWLDWQSDGSASYSGPWANPVQVRDTAGSGNALQWMGSWAPATDSCVGFTEDFPFVIGGAIGADCNGNGIPDDCDVPPICDPDDPPPTGCWPDCNENLVPDECELDGGYSDDCNLNEIPDECDIDSSFSEDCNENEIPDECDVDPDDPDGDGQVSADCQKDGEPGHGVPDECEEDCNDNDVPDFCDMRDCAAEPWCDDCQPDGILDACQLYDRDRFIYQLDDGTHERSLGVPVGTSEAWMNHFTTEPRAEAITTISLCCGSASGGVPATVYLWSDPNGDGNPTDGQVLASVPVVAENPDTDIFTTVDIPDTYVGPPGTSFFVGALMQKPADVYPCSLDEGDSAGQSWIVYDNNNPVDPNNMSAAANPPVVVDALGYPGNFMIRAEGVPFGPPPNDCNENGVPDECDLCGDLDPWPEGDGDVDGDDYQVFLSAFGSGFGDARFIPCADYDDDGTVTLVDYQHWLACYHDFNPGGPPPGNPGKHKEPRPIEVPITPRPSATGIPAR
ncbi:MAG: hypothetical protein JXQ75_06915 [Phycisphaerae bacterium]|nr:hypothetical protein [Phycisphaerae bacterium]